MKKSKQTSFDSVVTTWYIDSYKDLQIIFCMQSQYKQKLFEGLNNYKHQASI